MREGYKPTTAEDLIRMYDLNALAKERKQIKQQNKEVSALVKEFAETINEQIKELEDQVDGKISTWFFSGIPSAETEPEVNWTTDEEKSKHIGDIYYDQDTGNSYTYMYVDGKYQWTEETVGDVSEVLAIANKAQDTADRKRQIFVVEPYPPYEVGDMWIKEDKDIYRCRAKRVGGEFSNNDWVLASDYTNDDYAKGVEAQLNVYKDVVSTDYVLKSTFETSNEGIRSEVSSLTTIVEKVNVDVQELTETVDMFSVEMAQNTIVIPTDNNKYPIASTTFEIPFYGYFKGKQVIPNVSINGSYIGITASNTTSVIKFNVQNGVAIDQLSNSYEITYSYYYDGYNYVTTKNVTLTLAPKGSDGTSVNILGSYNSYSELKQAHPTGNVGDAYIVQGNMYVWNSEEQDWVDVGDIQGPPGKDGQDGTNGKSAYQIALDNGFVGTEEEYLASLIGTDGKDGKDGVDGKTPIKGVDYFDGKDGTNGTNGKSAYQLWLDAGNTGTEAEYLASLQGKDGYTPVKGKDYFDGYTPIKGVDYFDGVNGKDGTNGVSTYFYVRYSANENGSSMTTTPTSTTKYMGTSSTTSPTAPTSASAYTWVEIKGAKGDSGSPGQPGSNGLTSYLHVKYSEDGVTFTPADEEYGLGDKPSAWIGQYVDYTEANSTNFDDYTWYKFTEDIDDTLTGMQEDIANNKTDIENTKQDLLGELDKKASVENVTTILNEVKNLQTSNSQTIQILEEIQTNGVTQVKTENNYTFNKEGLIIEESGAKTKGIFDNKGVDIVDTQGGSNDLLYAGYVDEEKAESNGKLKQFEGQTIVYSNNMYVDNYLMIGTHSRLEDYEDGTGVFYLGG